MLAQAIAASAALERNVLSVRRNEVRNTKHRKDRVKGGRRKLLLARHSRTQSSDDDDAVLAVRRTDLGSEFSLGCVACSLFRPLLPFSSSLDAASFSGRIGCSSALPLCLCSLSLQQAGRLQFFVFNSDGCLTGGVLPWSCLADLSLSLLPSVSLRCADSLAQKDSSGCKYMELLLLLPGCKYEMNTTAFEFNLGKKFFETLYPKAQLSRSVLYPAAFVRTDVAA